MKSPEVLRPQQKPGALRKLGASLACLASLLCSSIHAEPVPPSAEKEDGFFGGRRLLLEAAFSQSNARSAASNSHGTPVVEPEWFTLLSASLFSPDAGRRQLAMTQVFDSSQSRLISRKARIQAGVEIFSWVDIGLTAAIHRYTATGFRHELASGANDYFLLLRQASALASAYPERIPLNLPVNGMDAAYFVRGKRTFTSASNGFFVSFHKKFGPVDPYLAIGGSALTQTHGYAAAGARIFTGERFYLQLEGYSEFVRLRIPDYSAGGTTWGALREEGVRLGAGFAIHSD